MNCVWFSVCGYKSLVFWKLFPCGEEKEQLIRRPLQTFKCDIIYMNRDKIIPQNSPIGIADTALDLFLHCTTCRLQRVLSCKMSA